MRQVFGPYEGEAPAPSAHRRDEDDDWGLQSVSSPWQGSAGGRVPFSTGPAREDTVESESSPGTYYHLKLRSDGTWWCDCPGYQYRQECKHAKRKQEETPW